MNYTWNDALGIIGGYLAGTVFRIVFLIGIIVSAPSVNIYGAPYGNKILAIYKASDGYTDGNNPIKWYFEPEMLKLGFTPEYHDLDSGTPDHGDLDKIRAVITWHNSGVMPDRKKATAYIKFLDKAAGRGVKLVFVNSFGAYGYREDGIEKWDLLDDINSLFSKMGFSFKGFWTDDPGKIRIVQQNRELVEAGGKQDPGVSRHYQMIVPVRSDVETHLALKRIDGIKGLGDGESSVILTSKSGGFALEQYVLHGSRMMLNPSLFLKKSLFYNDGELDAGIIIGDINNRELAVKNVRHALDYAKIKHTFLDLDSAQKMIAEDLLQHEILIIAVRSADFMPAAVLKKYAELGGRVIFARFADLTREYMDLLGLNYYSKSQEYFKNGFIIQPSFSMNAFPMNGNNADLNIREARITDGNVLATANDPERKNKFPLLWERTVGKGKILYWNCDILLQSKKLRGTLVQSLHYVSEYFVSGLVNVGMMMIDDFPAPLWNTYYKDYRRKYYQDLMGREPDGEMKNKYREILDRLKKYPDISDTDFIRTVWVRDILSFQNKFGFKYSAFLIFNYNKETSLKSSKDDFSIRDFYLAEGGLPVKMGFVALGNGWELGLHGYNHQSLTVTRPREYASEPWPDRETMVKALAATRREWEKIYSGYTLPSTYVAPHNIIDSHGLSALGEVFPSIRTVATVYMGYKGDSEQEFEFTKDLRFFQMPRLSSGYSMIDVDKYILYDAIQNFGVVSHFIHPDDVFDENRSNGFSGWEWMKSQFVNEFSRVNGYFPWLRWMTVKDAFQEFMFYANTNIRVRNQGGKIIVESSDGSDKFLYFRISLKKGQRISRIANCIQIFSNTATGDYVFKTNEPRSEIMLQ